MSLLEVPILTSYLGSLVMGQILLEMLSIGVKGKTVPRVEEVWRLLAGEIKTSR